MIDTPVVPTGKYIRSASSQSKSQPVGIGAVSYTHLDDIYSKLLAETKEAAPYLFLKGNVHLLAEKSVCVVGSRNASLDSMEKTERIVKSLIQRNIVVNAGLAKGIDTATHRSALKYGGRTIAVIGTPVSYTHLLSLIGVYMSMTAIP